VPGGSPSTGENPYFRIPQREPNRWGTRLTGRGVAVKCRRLQHVSSPYPKGKTEEVRAFYGTVLGLPEIPPPESLKDRQLVWYAAGGDSLELHFFPGTPDPEHPRHLCLEVDDLEGARRQLTAAGYRPHDTVAIRNRPRFLCRDPFGNLIEFTTILGDY
jgi:catechol 2,3-dioxygenase-like lactoylglutathione lyase family enzyme